MTLSTAYLKDQSLSLDGWLAKLKPFEHAKIVTYHRSWPYFTRRFHLEDVAELEPKPGIPPSPGHILEVINTMKSEKIGIILMETFYNRADADAVAAKTGAKVVVVATLCERPARSGQLHRHDRQHRHAAEPGTERGAEMSGMLELLLIPFAACLVLTGIHCYLGIHIVSRGVIFVDLALAQVAALGSTDRAVARLRVEQRAKPM